MLTINFHVQNMTSHSESLDIALICDCICCCCICKFAAGLPFAVALPPCRRPSVLELLLLLLAPYHCVRAVFQPLLNFTFGLALFFAVCCVVAKSIVARRRVQMFHFQVLFSPEISEVHVSCQFLSLFNQVHSGYKQSKHIRQNQFCNHRFAFYIRIGKWIKTSELHVIQLVYFENDTTISAKIDDTVRIFYLNMSTSGWKARDNDQNKTLMMTVAQVGPLRFLQICALSTQRGTQALSLFVRAFN